MGIMRERNSKGYRNVLHRKEQLISVGMFKRFKENVTFEEASSNERFICCWNELFGFRAKF